MLNKVSVEKMKEDARRKELQTARSKVHHSRVYGKYNSNNTE